MANLSSSSSSSAVDEDLHRFLSDLQLTQYECNAQGITMLQLLNDVEHYKLESLQRLIPPAIDCSSFSKALEECMKRIGDQKDAGGGGGKADAPKATAKADESSKAKAKSKVKAKSKGK